MPAFITGQREGSGKLQTRAEGLVWVDEAFGRHMSRESVNPSWYRYPFSHRVIFGNSGTWFGGEEIV